MDDLDFVDFDDSSLCSPPVAPPRPLLAMVTPGQPAAGPDYLTSTPYVGQAPAQPAGRFQQLHPEETQWEMPCAPRAGGPGRREDYHEYQDLVNKSDSEKVLSARDLQNVPS